jgi:Zn-dependent protease
MRMSWNLGKVAGIDIFLHPTLLLLLGVFYVFDHGLTAVALALVLFSCVLLHELGHALMARQFGIETEDITLYPIGGVARLRRMPRSPGAELAIALAGPAVNVVIAGVLALVWFSGIFGGVWEPSAIESLLIPAIKINAMLAVFNLVPAFPMDGGRVLRALLSSWMGRVRATIIAATLGRGLALVFGFYSLFFVWSPLQAAVAAFIYLAAGAELQQVLREEQLRLGQSDGIWTAPPGFHWVSVGRGVWQLAPISVGLGEPLHSRFAPISVRFAVRPRQ